MVPAACAFLAGCCALLSLAELPGGEVVAAAVALATVSALALRAWPVLALALGFAAAGGTFPHGWTRGSTRRSRVAR